MTECAICYELIKDNAKRFICRKCHLIICMKCFKETIERGLYVPTCCSCRTTLNYDDIIAATSRTYFKTHYIEHLADVQFKMLTEQTIQVLYPLIYKINRLRDMNINRIDITAAKLFKAEPGKPTFTQKHFIYHHALDDFIEFLNMSNITTKPEFENDVLIDDVCDELVKLQKIVPNDIFKQFLQDHWTIDEYNINVLSEINKLTNKKSDEKTVAKCEKCKLGIIIEYNDLSESSTLKYKCNSCKQEYCTKCLSKIDKNSEHKCKQEDIDSWEEIKKSTKLCPKCSSRIFRSMGCPQMFCTNCHTGFDWNTGEIINGNFHNPHRMEWLKNGAKNEINNCNDIDSIVNEGIIKQNSKQIEIPYYNELLRLLNYHNELNDVIREYNRKYNTYNQINYYDLLRWYYRNDKLELFKQIKESTYKSDIKSNERHKFKFSTILSIIIPINDIIYDGILTIINLCENYKNSKNKIPETLNTIPNKMPEILQFNTNINTIPNSVQDLNTNSVQNSEIVFNNTNIKIIKSDITKPQFFKQVEEIFNNMVNELIIFDNNLYSVEKIIDIQVPHFMFYTSNILNGYSLNLTNSGFETNYQLYFILNELCVINKNWEENYKINKEAVEKYVSDIFNKYPTKRINKDSKSCEILRCKYLLNLYKHNLIRINVIYTTYLTELQKVILLLALNDDFNFNNIQRIANRNRRNRYIEQIGELVDEVLDEININEEARLDV